MTASRMVLLDTNILVNAYDRSESKKQAIAINLMDRLVAGSAGVLSAQVLAEFFITTTRMLPVPLTVEQAIESISNYISSWTILDTTSLVVLEAARGVRDHQFSYFDAQIWAVARLNQIPVIFSEDFNELDIEGVQFVNPFSPEFKLDAWL